MEVVAEMAWGENGANFTEIIKLLSADLFIYFSDVRLYIMKALKNIMEVLALKC